jgi:hypothetical protein
MRYYNSTCPVLNDGVREKELSLFQVVCPRMLSKTRDYSRNVLSKMLSSQCDA